MTATTMGIGPEVWAKAMAWERARTHWARDEGPGREAGRRRAGALARGGWADPASGFHGEGLVDRGRAAATSAWRC